MFPDAEMPVKSNITEQSRGSILRNQQVSEAASGLPIKPSNSNGKKQVHPDEGGGSSDDDDKPIGMKKPNPKVSESKKLKPAADALVPPNRKQASVKKEENGHDEPIDNAKKEMKGEADELIVKKKCTVGSSSSDKKSTKKQKEDVRQIVKKEKKVYDLPGQKRDPPEQRDPSRIFYETLYQQVPTSEMAQIWMMECGLLPANVAIQVFEKKQKKAQTLRSPAKTPALYATNTSSKSVTMQKELSSATKNTKSVTVKKEQSSSADAMKKKKTPDNKILSKPSKKRKTADGSDEDGSDDDFEVISQPKKRKLAG